MGNSFLWDILVGVLHHSSSVDIQNIYTIINELWVSIRSSELIKVNEAIADIYVIV